MCIRDSIGGVEGHCELSFWGRHNIQNLAAAAALAYSSGLNPQKIWSSLPRCHTGWGRNQWLRAKNGGSILFDGYNANPESFNTLIENIQPLCAQGAQPMAVFGTMLELGENSPKAHFELGQLCRDLPWQTLVFVGPGGEDFARGWGGESKNCLLYTSPSPRDATLSRMPSSA